MASLKTIGQVANYKPLARCGMEELAAYQTSATPSGGVLFARKSDGDEKTAARQMVLDLFGPEQWDRPLNILTLPGVHWRFERKLLGIREVGWMRSSRPKRTHFTGVENDRSIYFASASQMPGLTTPNALVKPVRREAFPFAESAVKTRYASFFFADVDDVLRHTWVRAGYRESAGWDAAWLDYTGPLSVERLGAIASFYRAFIRETLIVTTLNARWNKATSAAVERAGSHSLWLQRHLPGRILHDIEYFDTSPMAQFAVCHH